MQADGSWQGVLRHVPRVDFVFDGDCSQAVGIDLPIAVINLAHRTDRWQAVSTRMAAIGLNKLIKVPAVEGAKLALDQIAPLLGQPTSLIENAPRSHYTMTRPAVGCFLSHLAVWQWMIKNKLPRVLVFEDDATPAANFDPARFRAVISSLPQNIGLVLLGRIIMNGMADRADGAPLARMYYFNGTFAYLITPAACRTLVSRLLPMNGHIDHQISKVLIDLRHEFAAYYTEPQFFEPDWSLRSDCYVPLIDEPDADRELGGLLTANRHLLLGEGRPLLAPVA
jgi:GR25 family glycosyltransferase involved in LPS biosynthesis